VDSVSVDLSRAATQLDLASRLSAIPPTARVRGIFLNLLRDDVARRRLLSIPELARLLAPRRSYAFYPARDFVEAYAVAGAIVHSDPLQGVRQLFTGATTYFSASWYGRAFTRFLQPDPRSALGWIERSRDYVANYGRWRLESRGPEHAVLHLFDEYFWLEGHRGGCEGLLTACGVEGELLAEQDGLFNGRLDIRWQLRN
jgi:uncharacterized protein (TIGR02265 family)